MADLKPIIEQSMMQYAGAVLQSRALVDVRDCLKPSARQIFYCMHKYKYTANKPFQPTAAAMGDALKHFYIHGDASCVGIIMRAGQSFAMRYPLIEVRGNAGTIIKSKNWAAERYTKARLSKLASYLFQDIEKDTIEDWRDNYANNEQFPGVLPTKGFYNLVNGTTGIGIGMACSVPQYNIRELNNALIYLLNNPNCDFEEIYCAPDFATGAILYNESEVKESMRNGTGFACKLRSVVEFDPKERCFVVTEIPYGVYTETICKQLEEIANSEDNPGIDRPEAKNGEKPVVDSSGATPLIKIYLGRRANPDRILKYLYKNTSLQHHYGINFTMLDKGKYPRLFTWKEMLQAHLDHEREVYVRGFEFDLKKIMDRLHIIEGLLIALARIEEVIQTIKSSSSTAAANKKLQENFLLTEVQAKAILDMKLSRLAHLEVEKIEKEKTELETEKSRIEAILADEELLKREIERGLRDVAEKFGDARRTKVLNLGEDSDNEPIERKTLLLNFTSEGGTYVSESSTLYAQRRNGVGTKFKLDKGEYVVDSIVGDNTDTILFFTSHGNFYHRRMGEFNVGEKQYLSSLVNTLPYESIRAATILSKKNEKKNIIFITKNGIIKKSLLEEYNLKRNAGATALNLDKGDEIVSVLFTNEERIGILSEKGNFIMIETKDIRPIGRVARGVVGIKLNDGDSVVSANIITPDTKEILSISTDGYSKRTPIDEFRVTGRATKGVKIQNSDKLCDFLPINNNDDILVVSNTAQIRVKLHEIALLGRGAQGTKTIKLAENSKVIKLSKI